MRVDGVESGEDHGLDLFKAGERVESGIGVVGNGVANFHVGNSFDISDEESDFARLQFVNFHRLGRKHTESFGVEGGAVLPQANSLTLAEGSLENAG